MEPRTFFVGIEIVLTCLIFLTHGVDVSCRIDNSVLYEGTCFLYNGTLLTWAEAKAYCSSVGAKLAKINSADQLNSAVDIALTNANVHDLWIGANDIDVEGNLIWDHDNSNATSDLTSIWSPSEPPNNDTSDCIVITLYYSSPYSVRTFECNRNAQPLCMYALTTTTLEPTTTTTPTATTTTESTSTTTPTTTTTTESTSTSTLTTTTTTESTSTTTPTTTTTTESTSTSTLTTTTTTETTSTTTPTTNLTKTNTASMSSATSTTSAATVSGDVTMSTSENATTAAQLNTTTISRSTICCFGVKTVLFNVKLYLLPILAVLVFKEL